jgi:hypothetical protein
MPFVRISEKDWDAVWWELVFSGPISRLTKDLVYAISEKQLRLLQKKKLPFELVPFPNNGSATNNNHVS